MELDKKTLIITERTVSVYRVALSIILSIATVYSFGISLYDYCQVGIEDVNSDLYFKTLNISSFLFLTSLSLSFNRTLSIDLEKEKLKVEYSLIGLKYNFYKQMPKLEYVSVFKNGDGVFEVNLWYVGNRHYKMFVFEQKKMAFSLAAQVSNRLNLDLLDATEKGNFKWIDNSDFKNTDLT